MKPLPARILTMHKAFGTSPGNTCGDCRHFQQHERSNTWYKCGLARLGGPATDWRVRWPACGRFEAGPRQIIWHA